MSSKCPDTTSNSSPIKQSGARATGRDHSDDQLPPSWNPCSPPVSDRESGPPNTSVSLFALCSSCPSSEPRSCR